MRRTVFPRTPREDAQREEEGAQVQDEAYAQHCKQAEGKSA